LQAAEAGPGVFEVAVFALAEAALGYVDMAAEMPLVRIEAPISARSSGRSTFSTTAQQKALDSVAAADVDQTA